MENGIVFMDLSSNPKKDFSKCKLGCRLAKRCMGMIQQKSDFKDTHVRAEEQLNGNRVVFENSNHHEKYARECELEGCVNGNQLIRNALLFMSDPKEI